MSEEFDKLAAAAAQKVNLATALVELQGASAQFFDRETRAYREAAGDAATDDGLAAWLKAREPEMQRAVAHDVAVLEGRTGEPGVADLRQRLAGLIEAWRGASERALDAALSTDERARRDRALRAVQEWRGTFIGLVDREVQAFRRLDAGATTVEEALAQLTPVRPELERLLGADARWLFRPDAGDETK